MHYYQFNIGNYRRQTAHLSLLEHAIYRMLIDTYYLTEEPIISDLDKLMRTHCIRSADEKLSLKNVLDDFFILEDNQYKHEHCNEEIEKYRSKSEKASASARARWDKNANALRKDSECNAKGMLTNNHKPLTNNKEPVKKKKVFKKPTHDEINTYCKEKNIMVDADRFINHYESNGWLVGKNKMKDWKATARNWGKPSEQLQQQSAPISKPLSNGRD